MEELKYVIAPEGNIIDSLTNGKKYKVIYIDYDYDYISIIDDLGFMISSSIKESYVLNGKDWIITKEKQCKQNTKLIIKWSLTFIICMCFCYFFIGTNNKNAIPFFGAYILFGTLNLIYKFI